MPTFPSSVPKAKQPSLVGCQDNCKQNRKRPIMIQATDTLFLSNKQKENIETDKQVPSLIPTLPTTATWFDHSAMSIAVSPPTSYCGRRWKGLKSLKYYLTSTLLNRNVEYGWKVRKLLVWTRITTMFYCCQQSNRWSKPNWIHPCWVLYMSNFLPEQGQPWMKQQKITKEDKSEKLIELDFSWFSLDVMQASKAVKRSKNALPDSEMYCILKELSTKGTTWLYIFSVGKNLLHSEREGKIRSEKRRDKVKKRESKAHLLL